MKISSPAFADNSPIPTLHTCMGENTSPPFVFDSIPADAKSLVLIVEDRDATSDTAVPWVHWLVFNIPPTTMTVRMGEIPLGGTEGYANGGTPGYEGPCPKYFSGVHHYYFELFALDTILDLPPTATKALVEPAMQGHIIEQATLVGLATGAKDLKAM